MYLNRLAATTHSGSIAMTISRFFMAAIASASALSAVPPAGAQVIMELEGGILDSNGGGTLGLFVPLFLDDDRVIFLNGRGTVAEHQESQLSFGAGYRQRVDGNWVLGAYGFYDHYNSTRGNGFDQISFGAEALGERYEARANVYLPLTDDKAVEDLSRAFVDGERLLFQGGREAARASADAEAGVKLPIPSGSAPAQLKFFGGGYWREGDKIDDVFGVKARAEFIVAGLPGVNPASTLAFGASVSYDKEDDTQFGVTARLRIPFGDKAATAKPFDPLTQRVERAEFVETVANSNGEVEAAEYVSNGQTVGTVVQLSSADSAAALARAASQTGLLNGRIEAAGANALILTDGDIALDDTLAIGDTQHLIGGGGGFLVRGAGSGMTATFTNTGAATTLTGLDAARDVVSMGSGAEVAYLGIQGGLAGISSDGASNVWVHDVGISRTAGDGIRLGNVAGATIERADIRDLYVCESSTRCQFSVYNPNAAPYAAVSSLGTSGLTVRDTVIDTVTYGIFAGSRIDESDWPPVLANEASGITVDNVTIRNTRREGLLLVAANDVDLNKVTIDNSKQGLDMDLVVLQGTSNVNIKDMSLTGGINGLMFISTSTLPTVTTNVRVDGLTIADTRNAGIFMNPVADISFKDVEITNAGSYGVFFYGSDWDFLGGPVKDIDFQNVSIAGATEAGLYFLGPSVNLNGDIAVSDTPRDCKVDVWGSYVGGSITQDDGSVLNLNGAPLNAGNFVDRCS